MSDSTSGSSTTPTPDPTVPAPPAAPSVPSAPAVPAAAGTPVPDTTEPQPLQAGGETAPAADPATDTAAAPATPTVVNDDSGQHVVMPDGTVVHTRHDNLPRSNAEQEAFELTHSGDQLRYPFKPGDKEYSAYSDPAIPNSHLARSVEQEIVSFAERVFQDPAAVVSPIWNALKGVFDGELKQAIETGQGSGNIVEV